MPPGLVAPAVAWLAHESCSMTGGILISAAGRVATAYVAETRGVYRSSWSIEQISEQMEAIQNKDDTISFPVVPSGHIAHLRYSFDMARGFNE